MFQIHKGGLMNEAFSVVDATHLIAKASLWEERDKVISKKLHHLNNTTLPKVSHDKQARIGCKGKSFLSKAREVHIFMFFIQTKIIFGF